MEKNVYRLLDKMEIGKKYKKVFISRLEALEMVKELAQNEHITGFFFGLQK